jgi:hypothetical protein
MESTPRDKIAEYFRKNLKKGYTEDALKWALIRQGYSRTAVELAIRRLNKKLAKDAPVLKEKPRIKYQIIDEHNRPIEIKKPWWKRIFG